MFIRSHCSAVGLMALTMVASCGTAVTSLHTDLCWQSLAPDTGSQNLRLAMTEPALASTGPDEAWLSWNENGPRILRWAMGRWLPAPLPTGSEEMRYPVVAASPSGSVVIAVSTSVNDGISVLRIARAAGASWEWLGPPLISSREAYTHAHEASIAFADDAQPVVAWSEERHVKPAGLFVARWDGSSWKRLGALSPGGGDYYLLPTIVVDAEKQIWLCWKEGGRGGLRVARWDDAAWRDIGPKTLRDLAAGAGSVAQPSLVVDGKGQAWVLWISSKRPSEASLALARWNGTRWIAVPAPHIPGGKDAMVWSAAMILRDDKPIVAWSQSDDTDNHRLYAAEWMAGERWNQGLSGLHLAEGVSDVMDLRLAAGDARSFFISWDEAGNDSRRTRLVRAYICAAGETPTTPPKSVVERDTWPTTVDDAARQIAGKLDNESKSRVRSTKKDALIQYHHGWGTGIRNSLGLWRGNEKLLKSCGQGKRIHPDDCSMIIIEAVWTLLQSASLD